jgi:anti-anti-sigma regulatory factor
MRFQLIRDRADALTILPGERFDFSCAGEFREASATLATGVELTVDFRDTRYIDSAALGMLLLLGEKTGGTQKVRIRNAKGQPKEALEQANFDRLFTIL